MALAKILPAQSGGRGTLRSMVKGRRGNRVVQPPVPSTVCSRGRFPSPRAEWI